MTPPLPPIYRLSQEIIDEILDAIHLLAEEKWWADRYDYLSNCALVCRSFFPRAQMHLFTHINLPGTHQSRWVKMGDYSRISALLQIIEDRPSIAQYIQNLSLYLPKGNTAWFYHNQDMLNLLQKINATQFPLRNLMVSAEPPLSSFKMSAYNTGFPHLRSFFKQAIAPYITTLQLEFVIRVPVELVTMCTHLRDFSLRYTTFVFQDPDILGFLDDDTGQPINRPVDRDRRPKIEFLEYKLLEHDYDIRPDTTVSRFLADRSLLDFSHLRCLTTFTDGPVRDLQLAQSIMDAAGQSLEDVIIEMHNHETKLEFIPSTTLSLEKQPNLQSLSCIAFFQTPESTREESSCGMTHTCATLRTISTQNKLRTFHLVLTVYPHAEETLLTDPDWEGFVSEAIRITSPLAQLSDGKKKLALTLSMHYHVSEASNVDEGAEEHAEGILEKLVNERLATLKDCPSVALETHVVIIEPSESDVYNE